MIKRIIMCVFIFSCLISYSQQMKSFLNKELIVKIGSVCEESPVESDCMGSELYITLYFDNREVRISELEIDSCNKESVSELGIYPWEKVKNRIQITNFSGKLPLSDVDVLSLELKQEQLVGRFKYLNGKTESQIFTSK